MVMELEKMKVFELEMADKRIISGGNPILIFIAGALVGGLIYDAYKTAAVALIKLQIEHQEYYDGPVHSQR
jgi:hypothetical protein